MQLRLERTDERLTRRSCLVLVDSFDKRLDIASHIDRVFPAPSFSRGFATSTFVTTLMEMMIDAAICLEDVRAFEADEAFIQMTSHKHHPGERRYRRLAPPKRIRQRRQDQDGNRGAPPLDDARA